jgi:hypothetical protein
MSTTFSKTSIHPSCVPKFCYQSVCCCLIRYFLVRIRFAECFTNSRKQFRFEVMSKSEHTFCSLINQHLRSWHEQRPSNEGELDSSVTGVVGRVHYTEVNLLLASFL